MAGVGITKINRIIQLKILEKDLLPNGQIQNSEFEDRWKTADIFSIDDGESIEGIDYHTLSWYNRSIDLDTLIDSERIVTGVRFRVVDSHIRLEVRFTEFDFQTGQLRNLEYSSWISNDATKKMEVFPYRPDRSTNSPKKSMPIFEENIFVKFQPSDIKKDAAQSTIPFIDATPIEALTPLNGVGLYLKTQYGYGGYIAPSLIVFDAAMHITPINNF